MLGLIQQTAGTKDYAPMTQFTEHHAQNLTSGDEQFLHETAGAHMVTSIPTARTDTPISEVLDQLRGQEFECADTVFVTDIQGRLEGIVRLNELFADGALTIGEIMEPDHEAVNAADDQEAVAVLAIRLGMIAVPVVDQQSRLIGAVPPEALFAILRAEHHEDLQRFAGINVKTDGPTLSLSSPLWERFRRRVPWLIIGLAASSVITMVMAGFEETIQHNVAAAFFVPALVYIAGAIGTQAVSVSVRALSNDAVAIGKLIRDEIIIGLGIGLVLGVISSLAVFLTFNDQALALAVGLAVLFGGAFSAVVGFGLPWIFEKMSFDPALGSGPICTIIQDATSLIIYFILVSAIVIG